MDTKKKIKAIIWPLIYTVLIATVCVNAALVFHSYYYTPIYISGPSMEPTLTGQGEMVDYGIIDTHSYAIDNITKNKTRFKVITTYYPFSNGSSSDYEGGYVVGKDNVVSKDASYKIKRIYAFPGESFKFQVYENPNDANDKTVNFYVKDGNDIRSWENILPQTIKFKRNINFLSRDYNYEHNEPLGENEYWVMGDNYAASYDCYSVKKPIYRDNIVGVLIAIEGQCKISRSATSDGGTHVSATCTNRKKYSWPKFF